MLICDGDVARVEGAGTVEEAEPLLSFLLGGADRAVDLAACTSLHLAMVQVLRAARPRLRAGPADPALARWVLPFVAPHARAPGVAT